MDVSQPSTWHHDDSDIRPCQPSSCHVSPPKDIKRSELFMVILFKCPEKKWSSRLQREKKFKFRPVDSRFRLIMRTIVSPSCLMSHETCPLMAFFFLILLIQFLKEVISSPPLLIVLIFTHSLLPFNFSSFYCCFPKNCSNPQTVRTVLRTFCWLKFDFCKLKSKSTLVWFSKYSKGERSSFTAQIRPMLGLEEERGSFGEQFSDWSSKRSSSFFLSLSLPDHHLLVCTVSKRFPLTWFSNSSFLLFPEMIPNRIFPSNNRKRRLPVMTNSFNYASYWF